jgi:amino acid adenylation domain-containing protein
LAVLKAGGAYVPLDPQFPRERLQFMLEDSNAPVLVTQEHLLPILPANRPGTLCLDRERESIAQQSAELPNTKTKGENLAYVIYTSGSTGKPKGVAIEHRAVVNFLASMSREPGISARDHLLAVTTLSFDIAGLEMFLPLVTGAQITIAPRAAVADGAALARLLSESGATMMQATPVTWRLLLDSGWQGRPGFKLLCGGEAMPRELANRLLATGGELWNLYGPTETTIWSTIHRVDSRSGSVPIGKAIANTQVYVLDENREIVPEGSVGGLYIGGDGLARGYWKRPETTEERFVPNPFQLGSRLYRTGDLVRRLPDGNLEYIGREDQQIKLRGYRIELGEIESVLEQQPGVRQAVVIVREDEPGDQRLAAYVVSHVPGNAAALRVALAARLPEYMVPSAFVFLDALPLTPNKKVDRKALPIPAAQPVASAEPVGTETQKKVAAIWRTLLKVPEVGLHDNFFALGGHSLLVVQVQSRLRQEFSREISIAELFERPTVAEVAELLDASKEATAIASTEGATARIERAQRDGPLPLTSAQLRLWFLDQLSPQSTAYSVPGAARLRGKLDAGIFKKTILEILRRHETLRTVFPSANGSPSQMVLPPDPSSITLTDLADIPLRDREAKAFEIAAADARKPFDLAKGPLFRTRLLKIDEEDHALVITVHHIVSDAWSVEIFWREFAALYCAFRDGKPSPLPELAIQMADFACWQQRSLEGSAREAHKAYWMRQLGGSTTALDLPADHPRVKLQATRGARKTLRIPPKVAQRLKALGQREGASPYMTLLAALNVLLHRWSGQDDILVGTAIAGRNRLELEDMIGFFVNAIVVRSRLTGSSSFRELLTQVRNTVLEGHEHQDMPLEELVAALDTKRDLTRTPLFQVFFNHLNGQLSPIQIPGLQVDPLLEFEFELESKFDFTIYVIEHNEQDALLLSMVYNRDLFDEGRMALLLDQYSRLLEQICDNPDGSVGNYSLLTESTPAGIPDPTAPLQLASSGLAHAKFLERAHEAPSRTAIMEDGVRWTYGRLESLSSGLAAWLQAHGIGLGDTVAVYGERSAALVMALLGTLRAGAAFCVLDPSYPTARLAAGLRAAKPKAWMGISVADLPAELEAAIQETAGDCRLTIPGARGSFSMAELAGRQSSTPAGDQDDPAYVVFTSGTTGEPKCIRGTHRPISHFVDWHVREFDLQNTDRFSMLSGLAHDPLLRDIFTPLSIGATLSIPAKEDISAPGRLAEWMDEEQISVAHLTPAMSALMAGAYDESEEVPTPLSNLRYAFFGGDVLSSHDIALLTRLAPEVQCVSFYGATETPQAMAYHRIQAADPTANRDDAAAPSRAIPIGVPISDVQILILNPAGQLAAAGELGEIHIRTPYLSQGYVNDASLTDERFLTNPFTSQEGDRMYRTGDLGRYRPDGLVEFAGRADRQIKIRGYRVEPGEIEAALTSHPGVLECAVIAREVRASGKELAAFVVPRSGQTLVSEELRAHLRKRLPEYLIPAAVVTLPRLPLTPNGKVDRRTLAARTDDAPRTVEEHALPSNQIERTMLEIWRQVLEVGKIGVFDNFFELGGHSLSATRLIARMRTAFQIDLPLRCIFIEPTIAGLAAHIRYDSATQKYSYMSEVPRWNCLVPAQPRGTRTPFFFVAGYQGADDTLLVLSRFISHLGLNQPVYGFRPRWMEGTGEAYASVEEAASEFLRDLRALQPKGPYLLGGHCVGGVVALEMAQQLMREGEEVKLLALLDTERPTATRAFLANMRLNQQRAEHMKSVLSEIIHSRDRSKLVRDLFYRKFKSKRKSAHPQPAEHASRDRLYELRVGYRRLMYEYCAQPYPGCITLFINEEQYGFDRDMGWKGVAKGGLNAYPLPGDHHTLLTQYGKEFAYLLRKCIDEALPEPVDSHDRSRIDAA